MDTFNSSSNHITNRNHNATMRLINQQQRRKKRQSSSLASLSPPPTSIMYIIILLLCQTGSRALTIQSRVQSIRSVPSLFLHDKSHSDPSLEIYHNKNHKRQDHVQRQPFLSSSPILKSSKSTKSTTTGISSPILRFDSSTSLQYRNHQHSDGDDHNIHDKISQQQKQEQHQDQQSTIFHKHQNDHQISNFFHTLWTSGKSKRAKKLHAIQKLQEQKNKEQYVLDEYLESIDRRYKRLHEDENESSSFPSTTSSQDGGFTSALQWLTQHSSDSTTLSDVEKQRQQEDAIYVLGLADLASKKLLQRHQLPVPKSKSDKSVVIDIGVHDTSLGLIKDSVSPTKVTTTNDNEWTSTRGTNGFFSILTSPINFAAGAITTCKSATITTIGKAMIIIQILQRMKLAPNMKHILATTSTKFNQEGLSTPICIGGKAFTDAIAPFVSFIRNTSGSKYSLQLFSVMAAAIVAFAISVLRPMTSKA
jgi:hypothetical protein